MTQAIGFFDSGIGGISVLQEARKILQGESFIYVADSKHAPYGEKSQTFIQERSQTIVDFLLEKNVKAVVIACNTATSHAAGFLRKRYELPIIGVEPGIKPALLASQTKHIAVLATPQTLKSHKFNNLAISLAGEVLEIPAAGLVELIEVGNFNNSKIINYLTNLLKPILSSQILSKPIDTIVLGCTHYCLIKPAIQSVVGENITLYETSIPVAKQLKNELRKNNLLAKGKAKSIKYYSNATNDNLTTMFLINKVGTFSL